MINKNYSNFLNFVVITSVLIILFVSDIPSKIHFNINNFFSEYKEIKLSYEKMTNNFIMKNNYEVRKGELLKQIELQNDNNNLFQEQVITLINANCLNNGIHISNIVFSDEQDAYSQEYIEHENASISIMRVSIEFKCSYENLIMFIDDLKNDRVNIAITNMRIINCNESTVSAAMDLNLYTLSMEVWGG